MWEKKKILKAMKRNLLAGNQNQKSFSRRRNGELSYRLFTFTTDQLQFPSMTTEVHLADGPTGFFLIRGRCKLDG